MLIDESSWLTAENSLLKTHCWKLIAGSSLLKAQCTLLKTHTLTRNKVDFAKGLIPGSLNIQGNNSFSTWAGWLLNYKEQFMLVAEENQMDDLTRKLMRIGLDNMYGFISNVDELGIELNKVDVINIEEFKTYINKGDDRLWM